MYDSFYVVIERMFFMIRFKVGILGAGHIAGKVADTLEKLDGVEAYAVASRDIEKAEAFGEKYNIFKRYGSYEELVNDSEVELIYIATPNSLHAEHARLALNAGKPVLVEKPFSYNAKTTEEILKLAKEKNLYAAEAMWIRSLPIYLRLIYNLKLGIIGDIHHVTCSLGYKVFDKERIKEPSLGGGALLDLCVYPINMLQMIYGTLPISVISECAKLPTNVDAQEVLQLRFGQGQTASVFVTAMYKADNNAVIYGERGYVELDNINCPTGFRVYNGDGQLINDTKLPEKQISGYEFEFLTARDNIIIGKIEDPYQPQELLINTMKFLDYLRDTWKIKFPME